MTRPWVTAGALAALFISLEGLTFFVSIAVFHPGPGSDYLDLIWEILRHEWPRHVLYLVIAVAAACVLRLAARTSSSPWPTLVMRAVVMFVPVLIVVNFAVGILYFVKDGVPLSFFGFEVLS